MEFPWGSSIPRGEDFGIIAEPYFDVDFDDVLYLTDTGRRWDGDEFNIRDKVETLERGKDEGLLRRMIRMNRMIPAGLGGRRKTPQLNTLEGDPVQRGKEVGGLRFRKTWDIIEAAEKGLMPDKIMLNTHPQRWADNPVEWTKELIWLNVKNVIKKYFLVKK